MSEIEAKVHSTWHTEVIESENGIRRVSNISEWNDRALLAWSLVEAKSTRADDVNHTSSIQPYAHCGIVVVRLDDGETCGRCDLPREYTKKGEQIVYVDVLGDSNDTSILFPTVTVVTCRGSVFCVSSAADDAGGWRVEFKGNMLEEAARDPQSPVVQKMRIYGDGTVDSASNRRDIAVKVMRQDGTDADVVQTDVHTGNADTEVAHTVGPEFVAENGYRGPREGYTFWKSDDGKVGYFREDVMKRILGVKSTHADALERRQGDGEKVAGPTVSSGLKEECGSQRSVRCKAIRNFVFLHRQQMCLLCSGTPEDGNLYVLCCNLGQDEGQQVHVSSSQVVPGHSSGICCIESADDGTIVATGSYDQKVRIWDPSSWACLKELQGHGSGIKCLKFIPKYKVLLTAAADNTIRVWSTEAWMCLRQLHGRHEDTTWPVCLDFCHYFMKAGDDEGKQVPLVASGSNGTFGGSTLKIFDFASGDCLSTFAQLRFDHKGSACALKFVRGGTYVVSAASDGTIALWAVECRPPKKQPKLKKGFLG